MDKIFIDVGGIPGIDCGKFCKFCFYKNVDFNNIESLDIGCASCPPDQMGCNYCQYTVTGVRNNFKPLYNVLMDLEGKLAMQNLWGSSDNPQIVVYAEADTFFYPHLIELATVIKESQLPLHLSYTSGKVSNVGTITEKLISLGLDELTFSAFSTDPEIRGKWMRDENPEESIRSLKLFCENIDVNASVVVVPGVNDGENIFQTCSDLEEWGVKRFLLRRFANFKYQGLILNTDRPIIEGIKPQTVEDYLELVKKITNEFSFQVLSYPYYDAKKDFPFAILKKKNWRYLEILPEVKSEATVITGKIAAPFLRNFFGLMDDNDLVNVVNVDKEIADLITHDDLKEIDLSEVKRKVIIPQGALVHNKKAQEILSRDGIQRKIVRGPLILTHHYHESVDDFTHEELIEQELKSFKKLIDKINLIVK